MGWRGPEAPEDYPTLGWIALEWMAEYLPSPADESGPLILTDEQAQLVLRWYAIEPETGAFAFRRGAIEMPKGWGKSPMEAANALFEFAGPVLFDGWDAAGEPVGRPWGTLGSPPPLVQIAALSEDQTDNTYDALYDMLVANEHRAARALGIDAGRTRLYLTGRRGTLEPVTASAGSREGQRLTYANLDETGLWLPTNGGDKLARVLRRNLGKMGGRSRETTNAYVPGEHSVAERTAAAAAKQRDILYYARRPTKLPAEDASDEELLAALREVYGDAWWIQFPRLLKESRDPGTPWEDTVRFYLNTPYKGAGKAVAPKTWNALRADREVAAGERIGLGFAAISESHAVLRGCTADGHSFAIRSWSRPDGAAEWRIPRAEVTDAVDGAFATYDVGRMLCEPAKWWTDIESWAHRHGDKVVLFFDTNLPKRFGPACDRWLAAIREATHTHDGDALVTEHVIAAHLRKTRVRAESDDDDERTLRVLTRGEDGRHIGGGVADVLAYEAAMTMPAPEPPPPQAEPRFISLLDDDDE